jgi:two-component system, NarL family, sensor histidine kinase UhpB
MTISIGPSAVHVPKISAASWSMRDVLSLFVAVIFTQAAFWCLVTSIVYLSPLNPSNMDKYRVLSLQTAPVVGIADPRPSSDFQAAPSNKVLAPNPGLVRFSVLAKEPTDGIGIFIPRLADNAIAIVNGQRLSPPRGEWGNNPDRTGVVGLFFEVPASLLVQGENQIDLLLVRSCCRTYVAAVYAGPLPAMQPIAGAAHWLRINLAWIIIATSLLIGLVAASLLSLRRGQAFLWSIIGCSLTVAVGTYFYIDTGNFIHSTWRAWYGHVLGAILGYLAFLSLVNAWTSGPAWLYRVILGAGLVSVLVTGALAPFQTMDGVVQTARIFLIVIMIGAISGVVALLWRYVQTKEVGRYWQAGLLLISSSAAIIDYVYALDLKVQPIYFVPFSNLTLMTAIGIALAQQGAKLYLEAEAANQTLEARISVKEQELVAAAQALRQQEAETATQAERARIMRDMHDGMGGQLLSLLIQTRDPDTPREELEQAVGAAISDLRLLVDSLDSVGDSLDVALAVFRDRLTPRLQAANIEFGWHNELTKPTQSHSPSVTLNVYRILQEAMTNALRYSEAKTISISIAPALSDGLIHIKVIDDGRGIAPNAIMGRGLANMRRRAQEIGGQLNVDTNSKGTTICLVLPA